MTFAPVAVLDSEIQLLDRNIFTHYLLEGSNNPEPFGPKLACLEFRGCGVIGGSFFARKSEVENLLAQRGSIDEVINLMKTASGSFTLLVFDRSTRDLYFLNDPLGGGFLMRYQKDTFTAVSTDLTSLRQVVHSHGHQTTRDPLYELSGFATGTQSHAADTPFREISVEDSGFGLHISADGELEILDYGVNDYLYSGEPINEQELIERGAEEIRANLKAVLNYQPSLLISDITGGFDSRLMLAGISSLDACASVLLRSIRTAAEWEYAEGLAAAYEMELTDSGAFAEVWGIRQDLYEDAVGGARKSGGLIANEGGSNAVPFPIVKLQGGYGETFRAFNSQYHPDSQPLDTLEIVKTSWQWSRAARFAVREQKLFRDSLTNQLAERSNRVISKGFERNVPNSHISSYWYAKGRNRYWIGHQSYQSSRTIAQFDPLYSTSLIAAANRTTFARRRENMIGLQVMKELDSNLLEYPFHNAGVPSKMFLDEHPDIRKGSFPNRPYVYRKLDFSPIDRLRMDLRRDEVTTQDQERATALSLNPHHVAGLRKWGAAAFETIKDHSELKEFFDLGALSGLLIDPFSDRPTAQGAIDFLGVLFRAGLLRPDSQSKEDELVFG